MLSDNGLDAHEIPPAGCLTLRTQAELRILDWVIIDIADPASVPLAAYLQGSFVPMLRIQRVQPGAAVTEKSMIETELFGAFEVGYAKDIVRWTDLPSLKAEIVRRIDRMQEKQRLLTSCAEAEAYFESAAQRDVAVFVSYAGADRDKGNAIATALCRKFRKVFDYRDDRSLTPSQPWIREIFENIRTSKIGVALYSDAYFKSGHCSREAQAMAEKASSGEMVLVGVRLSDDVRLPEFLGPLQNLRGWKFTAAEVSEEVAGIWDNLPAKRRPV